MSNFCKDGSIQRCPHDKENPYAMINLHLIRDFSISPECRWLLIYLLSNRDNWNIKVQQIINHVKPHMGRDKVHKLFKEAIDAGYMCREEIRVPNVTKEGKNLGGFFKSYRYLISESPKFKKCFRHPEIQDTGNEDPENTDYKKEQGLKKEHKEKKQQQTPPASAAGFYKCIEGIGLTLKEQKSLMKYPESKVQEAVKFATHPKTKIKTTLIKTIMWAIKENPDVPELVDIEANRKHALDAEKVLQSDSFILEVGSEKVLVYSKSPYNPKSYMMAFEAEDFVKKLEIILKECKFRLTK